MNTWVRYSIAAYVGMMLAGTLITPKQTDQIRFASADYHLRLDQPWPRHPKARSSSPSSELKSNYGHPTPHEIGPSEPKERAA